jgi:hypothetical protein
MTPVSWTAEQSIALLAALRSILTLNGTASCSDAETQLIEGVRRVVLQHAELTDAQLGQFPQPADLAAAITDPEHRRRAGELLAVAPYASRPFDNTKLHIADRFVEALGEDMHEMEDFNGARAKHCGISNTARCAGSWPTFCRPTTRRSWRTN